LRIEGDKVVQTPDPRRDKRVIGVAALGAVFAPRREVRSPERKTRLGGGAALLNEKVPRSTPIVGLEPDALEALDRYGWPGNVRELIRRALESTGGNKVKAAELLRISRKRLYAKIRKYTLS
jgi:transcriptional regulator of acetoin/glycerol metabolism